MKKKIGLFGGTFNPIHFGHINLALELKEKAQLDEIWFIPASISPFKSHIPPISFAHRSKMIELAIHSIPGFLLNECEAELTLPNYTYHTLKFLFKSDPAPLNDYFLLLGEDAIKELNKWYCIEEIVKMVPFLIGKRTLEPSVLIIENANLAEAIERAIIHTRLLDISSSDIRQRLEQEKYCGHLLPDEVLKYIAINQLYPSNK